MKKLTFLAAVAAAVLSLGTSIAAQAALAIIAHPGNSISGISADDAQRIFLGKTGEFANGRRATPVDQTAGASRAKFLKSVIQKDEGELKAYWSKLMFSGRGQPPKEVGDDAAVKAWVAGNPDAIGYVDGKFVDGSVKVLLIIP
ncbi:MAG: phosphate ABC transporter substrate-binding protein [Chromatiales bacterium]|nr:phosphate ABC transporter substrate-binding protein [Chromatiales bacterium]